MAKILVADDQPLNRKLIKIVLEGSDHVVLEASDGVEALAVARRERPDLVITDIVRPGIDGFEFVRQLRADPLLAGTRVVFYTATYLEEEARRLAQSCGVSRIIFKPAQADEIIEAVQASLGAVPAAPAADLKETFDREHLQLLTNKLARKVDELEQTNLRLTEEIGQRRRAELALHESQRRLERLSSLREVSSDINSAIVRIRERGEFLREAARLAVMHGQFSMVAISLFDEATGRLAPVARAEEQALYARETPPFPTQSAAYEIARLALARRELVLCNDIEAEGSMESWKSEVLGRGHRAAVALPLSVKESVLGVVEFYAPRPDFFNEDEVRLLRGLAADLSFALQYIDNEERINYLAYYDNLTGLPNRVLFCDRVHQLIHAAQGARRRAGMIVLDVERFSAINDTFGRHAGDALLKQVTERLKSAVRNSDWLASVARSSFAVYLPAIRDDGEIVHFIENVTREIASAPFAVEGEEMRLGFKCGASVYPADGTDAAKLLASAETALQRAKASGEEYLFFTAQMNERMAEKLSLENQLRRAIQNDQFVLYYQPIFDARTGRVARLEALLRWNHPEKGLVPPAGFIPVLEESGLIVDAGAWVLGRAAADYRKWAGRLKSLPRLSVNVSPLELKQKDFAVHVAVAASTFGAGNLELEITEGVLMEDVEQNVQLLSRLSGLGVGVVIDDFGTGYSSLSYLAQLPVSALKIDRAFIHGLNDKPKNMFIVTAVISLAHSLGLKVVAEGVETEAQAQLLRSLKCDELQGYLFSAPVPVSEVERFFGD